MQRMLSSKVLTCLSSFKVRVEDATTLLLQHAGNSSQGHWSCPAHQQIRICCKSSHSPPMCLPIPEPKHVHLSLVVTNLMHLMRTQVRRQRSSRAWRASRASPA